MGHGRSPCDGKGAVVKSTATQHLLKGRLGSSFSSPKEFFEWYFATNNRMVIARPTWRTTLQSGSTYVSNPIVRLEFDGSPPIPLRKDISGFQCHNCSVRHRKV